MALDRLAILGIKVDPTQAITGAKKASNAIKGVGAQASRVKNAIFSLQGALVAIGGGAVATSFVRTAASMEKLQTQLKTLTGSTEAANDAFDFLADFTTRTPYEIDQVTQAYAKLKALGLDPTEESLTAFGNTASAMGKDLLQMIEAVADATTMEFERLKEFGIKSKQEGDIVKFTFQGVTTSVKKNAEDIEEYLTNIGLNQFGGAMADQMNTFDGALSNLRGSWTLFQNDVMKAGPFNTLTGLLNEVQGALFGDADSLADAAKSAGQAIDGFIRESILGVAFFADTIRPIIRGVWDGVKTLVDGFNAFPPWVQEIGIIGAILGGKKMRIVLAGLGLAGAAMKKLGENVGFINEMMGEFNDQPSLIEMIAPKGSEKQVDSWVVSVEKAFARIDAARTKVIKPHEIMPFEAKEELSEWQKIGEAVQNAWDKAGNTIEDSLADAMLGLKSWKDATKAILQDVAREFIKTHILKGVVTGISDSIAGAFGLPTAEVPSANGGGFTGRGGRSGGVDGKGGFPAILHPNETVIDHTKGQEVGGVVVHQTINVTTGLQQTVRTEIANMLPQIAQASKAAVLDARKRGGSFAGAFA